MQRQPVALILVANHLNERKDKSIYVHHAGQWQTYVDTLLTISI